MEEKNSAWLKMKQKRDTRVKEQYREKRSAANKIIRKNVKCKKREFQDNWLREMEEENNKKQVRRFYQKVSLDRDGNINRSNTIFCRDKTDNLITNSEEIKKR